jgi:hypothetical protein
MYIHPAISKSVTDYRRRDLIARAEASRLARAAKDTTPGGPRPAGRPEHGARRLPIRQWLRPAMGR